MFSLETNAGKATVSLRLDLEAPPPVQDLPHHHQSRKYGPSQQRRRERRAAERQAEQAVAEEASESSEVTNAKTAVGEIATIVENENLERTIIYTVHAEEALETNLDVTDEFCSDESFYDSIENEVDCELYEVKYFDTLKPTKAQDAVDFVNEKLKFNFDRYKVKESDRVFKIGHVKKSL